MKTQQLKRMKPDPNDCLNMVKGGISDQGKNSAAWKVTYSLFQIAQKFYSTLDFFTSERLSVFVSSKTYLTTLQEHDLVALTALYIQHLALATASSIVEKDTSITEKEREVLLSAIAMFRVSTAATCAALGNPRWVEDG